MIVNKLKNSKIRDNNLDLLSTQWQGVKRFGPAFFSYAFEHLYCSNISPFLSCVVGYLVRVVLLNLLLVQILFGKGL